MKSNDKKRPIGAVELLVGLVIVLMPLGGHTQKRECDCDSRKQYYLSSQLSNGAEAKKACVAGFHMAALWEILDTSNLKYAQGVPGVNMLDQGAGPPLGIYGWIRTGWSTTAGSLSGSSVPGQAHCFLWTNGTKNYKGRVVRLANDWTEQWKQNEIGSWEADAKDCDSRQYVWCMQD